MSGIFKEQTNTSDLGEFEMAFATSTGNKPEYITHDLQTPVKKVFLLHIRSLQTLLR
jgi:hypothetical protein